MGEVFELMLSLDQTKKKLNLGLHERIRHTYKYFDSFLLIYITAGYKISKRELHFLYSYNIRTVTISSQSRFTVSIIAYHFNHYLPLRPFKESITYILSIFHLHHQIHTRCLRKTDHFISSNSLPKSVIKSSNTFSSSIQNGAS